MLAGNMADLNAFFDVTKNFVSPHGLFIGNSLPPKAERNVSNVFNAISTKDVNKQLDIRDTYDSDSSNLDTEEVVNYDDHDGDDNDGDNNDDNDEPVKKLDDVYSKYNFNKSCNTTRLPIDDAKENIMAAIQKHSVIIVEGDTGCGKTTQVPQFILDDACRNNEYCKVVCTQPRRIAAVSVSQRVSNERNWPVGSIIGYQVALHENKSDDTRVLYCTTGVLLYKLINAKSLTAFTHIILDEVHERDQDMDFLLIIIRRFLTTNSRNVKIILMSATINTTQFADYFKIRNQPAPIITVSKARRYNVAEFYLDDLACINTMNYAINYNEVGISNKMFDITVKLIVLLNDIEKKEIAIDKDEYKDSNSILIFLPGIYEIDTLCQKLKTTAKDAKFMPIRLHSLIPVDEQQRIFNPVPRGYRKIILATNIAESSITVPDVKYVIDFCLTKSLMNDSATNITKLCLHWCSKANCRQRAGRAGRVMNGRVYRMIEKQFYEKCLSEYCMPEMLRCPLENVILKAKLLNIDSPRRLLALAMSPPKLCDILNTILTLKEIGAMFRLCDTEYSIEDGDLTFIGRVMANLPLDIRLTRLIVIGYVFSCLEDAIVIAAGLSVRSIFKFQSGMGCEIACHIQKLTWADGSGSDLFAILNAYKKWTTLREQGLQVGEPENSWAKRSFINLRSIKEMHMLVLELKERLLMFNIKTQTAYQRIDWRDRERSLLLNIIIAGGFYPHFFTRSNLNFPDRERSIYRTLCNHNPCDTVYFTNFKSDNIGQLYIRPIKELFCNLLISPKNISVHFQPGSGHIFVTFKSDPLDNQYDNADQNNLYAPGKLRPELYKAVRMRLLRMPTVIRVMNRDTAIRYAVKQGIGEMVDGVWQPLKQVIKNPELVALPSLFHKFIRGYITHIESCNTFFFQPLKEMERLSHISETLNVNGTIEKCKFKNPSEIAKGMVLAAPFCNKYQRARILCVVPSSNRELKFKVLFTDFGNTADIECEKLRYIPHNFESLTDMPPRSFLCRLAFIEPSPLTSQYGKWPEEAINYLRDIAENEVEIEVYSVVKEVANVILRMSKGTLNDMLVKEGFAIHSEENFLSKADHDNRMRSQSEASRFVDEYKFIVNKEYLHSIHNEIDVEVVPPPQIMCSKGIALKGPFSPLEMQVFSAVKADSWKTVEIERQSVNAVLLDTDPHDMHERLVVAACVNYVPKGTKIIARNITLMPNIHGFAALMTLLFCPTARIKSNTSNTKYVSVLAGLGYDNNTRTPFFENHDIVINFDVEITQHDIQLINQLRYNMDSMLYTATQDDERPQISRDEKTKTITKIKDLLIRLLNKDRKFLEPQILPNNNSWEEQHCATNLIKPKVDIVYESRSIFPLHSMPRLNDEDETI